MKSYIKPVALKALLPACLLLLVSRVEVLELSFSSPAVLAFFIVLSVLAIHQQRQGEKPVDKT